MYGGESELFRDGAVISGGAFFSAAAPFFFSSGAVLSGGAFFAVAAPFYVSMLHKAARRRRKESNKGKRD